MAYTNAPTNVFHAYGLNGKKLSFANWISNISPEETPFVSMTGKESIDQVQFTWQVDSLAKANAGNAQAEGFVANPADVLRSTQEIHNNTQLLAKVVSVSDTANATANYGRGRELMYQLEKAGAEIKRDLEAVFLTNGPGTGFGNAGTISGVPTGTSNVRTTGGVRALIGTTGANRTVNLAGHTGVEPDQDFGAIVVKDVKPAAGAAGNMDFTQVEFEAALWDITAQLYLAGSKANTIMIHPSLAKYFTGLMEKEGTVGATRVRMFENRKDIDVQVNVITDPLGQKFRVIYNRHMPKYKVGTDLSSPVAADRQDALFIFNSADWTQMVLRAPQRTELAKQGDSTQYMITMETGLRHRNPYASAWLTFSPK